MAFRPPTQLPRRQTFSNSQPPALEIPPADLADNESTQWVLFSPQPSTQNTTSTRTAGRLSDFGSFGTTRSAEEEPLDEDGTELDSLDDGLHAFRAPSVAQESPRMEGASTMLPVHDGLGSFHASSQLVQDQLWHHEQYNPARSDTRRRRRSSVQQHLDTVAENEVVEPEPLTLDPERERWQRIEKWRMDQSRAVLEEIEKQTRRRSRTSRPSSTQFPHSPLESVPETHNQPSPQHESIWQRITKVMRELIGIDESLLSVIFGESLPDDQKDEESSSDTLDMNEAMGDLNSVSGPELWQTKLLHRIARELGVLVHQFCEHPGAFSTYVQMAKSIPNEYAGMPVRPPPEESAQSESRNDGSSVMSPQFAPTIDPNKEHAAHWGIEDDDSNRMADTAEPLSESARLQQEKEYWERELDVMMVFRYLRSRFGRGSSTEHSYPRRQIQDPSRRAAIIRQHHPLVARAHSRQVRHQSQHSALSGPTGISSPLLRQHFRRPGSSCASQSAKRSGISSKRTLTSSSRNYWDIGGSVDSGSAVPVGWDV